MTLTEYFELLWHDYTLRTITLGTAVLGAISGMLGSFAVLRKESLLGDAISHAALPGIALAFLITGAKNSEVLLMGALVAGVIGTLWIRGITSKTLLKSDTALGVILSTFFGFGMLLLTFIQKQPNANQAGLDKYLFGQAATLVVNDVRIMVIVTGISLVVMLLFWKEFKILLFDPDYAKTLGFNVKFIDMAITFLIVLAIVLGLQTVGVILMSAILLAPAAAARQWTHNLAHMVILAGIFGGMAGVLGTAVSASEDNLPTGPVIVLVASVFVLCSLIFSPKRGLLFREIRFRKNRTDLQLMKTLQFMYDIAKEHQNVSHPHAIKILNDFQGYAKNSLKRMESQGWITLSGPDWALTPKGFEKAKALYNQNQDDD